MPRFEYQYPREPLAQAKLGRSFACLAPVDWFDFVPDGANLPGLAVLVLFHPGNGTAEQAIAMFHGEELFDGTATGAKLKLIIVAVQGVSIGSGGGGDFNSGLVGTELRGWLDDVDYVFGALDVAEQLLVARYTDWVGAPPPLGTVFDRTRLAVQGFSNGAQMAYRVAYEAAAYGWNVRAIAACSASLGGWLRNSSFTNGDPEDYIFLPPVGCSLMAIHGELDNSFPWFFTGTGKNVQDGAEAQLVIATNWVDYVRADLAAVDGVDLVIANNGASPVAYAAPHPSATVNRAAEIGTPPTFGAYLLTDATMGHEYPDNTSRWGTNVASRAIMNFLMNMVPLAETY